MRSDQERNRKSLIKAASKLAARHGTAVKMSEVAETAEVSTATAYRHFPSVDDILVEFRFGVGKSLRQFSATQTLSGVELLEAVCGRWVELVMKHGRAMVATRSDQGYLKRLRSGAEYLTVQADALRKPIAQAADELGIDDPGDEGLFLWNILFDPREIFDLTQTVGLSLPEANARLVGAYIGALRGWSAA